MHLCHTNLFAKFGFPTQLGPFFRSPLIFTVGMCSGMMPHVKTMIWSFSVNFPTSQFFIYEAFQIVRSNVTYDIQKLVSTFPRSAGRVWLQVQVEKNIRRGILKNLFSEMESIKRTYIFHFKDRYTLLGYQGSRIFWESSNDTWVSWLWLSRKWNSIPFKVISGKTGRRLTLTGAKTTYPFGLYGWTPVQVTRRGAGGG